MRRILLEIGPIHLQTFGVMIALGFLAGLWLATREARRKGLGEETVADFSLYALILGIIGARVGYILIYSPAYYWQNPSHIVMLWDGGLSIHGAIVGGVLAGIWFARRRRISFWRLADTLAPSLILGQAIGRVGCDVFGRPLAQPLPWAVLIQGQWLHPSQVYEFLLDYAIFLFLWYRRARTRYDGQLFLQYVALFSLARGVVEFTRFNPVIYGPFTVAHLSSLIFILGAGLASLYLRRGLVPPSPEAAPAEPSWLPAIATLAAALASLLLFYGLKAS